MEVVHVNVWEMLYSALHAQGLAQSSPVKVADTVFSLSIIHW